MSESYTCKQCGRSIEKDPDLSRDVFESMHLLCFHLEFEHPGDPDLPCDDPSCHQFRIETYEHKLRELDIDPNAVIGKAVEERFTRGR